MMARHRRRRSQPGGRRGRLVLSRPAGPAPAGQPITDAVTSYCLLDGLSVPINFAPYHGYQCVFKSDNPASLYFHSGPRDVPLTCAPENNPMRS